MSYEATAPSFAEIRKILKELSISQKEAGQQIKEAGQKIKELSASRKEVDRRMAESNEQLKRQMAESNEQLKRRMAESNEQLKRQMAESNEQLKRQIAENNKGLNKARDLFETQWGRLVESLVQGKLIKMLNERGIEVRRLSQRTEASYTKEDGTIQQKEFDLIAGNGEEIVALEVKTALTPEKVTYFINSLRDFKKYFPDYRHKTVYGAVAYLRSESEAQIFSQRQGLFVIRATGDSASLINTKDFKPKAFN